MPNSRTSGKGGRPPKFREPRRPITVTLPERTLEQLERIDGDRARAIVKLAAAAAPEVAAPAVEIVEVSSGVGILVVAASPTLSDIPFIRLAEISPGRHLVALEPGTSVEALEIALLDALHGLRDGDDSPDRATLEALLESLSGVRRQQAVSKAEILFVATGDPGVPRRAAAR